MPPLAADGDGISLFKASVAKRQAEADHSATGASSSEDDEPLALRKASLKISEARARMTKPPPSTVNPPRFGGGSKTLRGMVMGSRRSSSASTKVPSRFNLRPPSDPAPPPPSVSQPSSTPPSAGEKGLSRATARPLAHRGRNQPGRGPMPSNQPGSATKTNGKAPLSMKMPDVKLPTNRGPMLPDLFLADEHSGALCQSAMVRCPPPSPQPPPHPPARQPSTP